MAWDFLRFHFRPDNVRNGQHFDVKNQHENDHMGQKCSLGCIVLTLGDFHMAKNYR